MKGLWITTEILREVLTKNDVETENCPFRTSQCCQGEVYINQLKVDSSKTFA